MYRAFRMVAVAGSLAAAMLAPAGEASACGFLSHLFGCCRPAACDPCAGAVPQTTYRPLFPCLWGCHRPVACDPCAAPCPQPCLRPVTCYRTECVTVPVTTYRPCTTCDPCTGCPTTVLRPVTSFVRQVRRVPYTVYRQVGYGCGSACSPCATGAGCAADSGCGSCAAPGSVITTPATPAPSLESSPLLPGDDSPSDSGLQTSPGPSSSSPPPATFETSPSSKQSLQKPIPDAAPNGASPKLIDPESRSTRLPSRENWSYRTTAAPARAARPLPAAATPLDDDGWRPARR